MCQPRCSLFVALAVALLTALLVGCAEVPAEEGLVSQADGGQPSALACPSSQTDCGSACADLDLGAVPLSGGKKSRRIDRLRC